MDIQKLRYFISVAKNLSLTEAAVELGITQSAVSQQISDLEKQVGTQLIIRNKRPFQLTWVGKTLLEEAFTLVAIFDRASERIQLASNGKKGYLKIGFLSGMEHNILPQVIKEFRNLHPHIFTSLQQYNWTGINDALSVGEIDIGFTLSHCLEDYPDLVSKKLSSGSLCVAVPHSHPSSSEKVINLADLAKEPFVMFNEEADPLLNKLTIKACAEHGFLPNIANRSRDLASLLVMVETGAGIMLVPEFVRDNNKSDICIIKLGYPNIALDVIVANNYNNQNPAVTNFVKQLYTCTHTSLFRDRRTENLRLVNIPSHH